MPSASAAFVPSSSISARYAGSVQAFATMRAPWPGLAASVIAMRSAISGVVTSPLAASRSRTATSSFSPSVSRMFISISGMRSPASAPANVRRVRPATRRRPLPPARPTAGRTPRGTASQSPAGRAKARSSGFGYAPNWRTTVPCMAAQVMRRADVHGAAGFRPVVLHPHRAPGANSITRAPVRRGVRLR